MAGNAFSSEIGDNAWMAERWKNHMKAWRKYAGLTLEELGGRMDPPISKGMLSQYESGKRAPLQERLAAIAAALGTTPGQIIDSPPGETVPAEIIDMWQRISVDDRPRVRDIIRTFVSDGETKAG